jgi:hypothetical protein
VQAGPGMDSGLRRQNHTASSQPSGTPSRDTNIIATYAYPSVSEEFAQGSLQASFHDDWVAVSARPLQHPTRAPSAPQHQVSPVYQYQCPIFFGELPVPCRHPVGTPHQYRRVVTTGNAHHRRHQCCQGWNWRHPFNSHPGWNHAIHPLVTTFPNGHHQSACH